MSWPKVCGPTTPSTVMPACVWNLAHGSARRGPELVVDHDVDVVEAEPFLDQAHLGAAVALRVRLVSSRSLIDHGVPDRRSCEPGDRKSTRLNSSHGYIS